MKVFLHYEDTLEDEEKMTIKLTLPKSWRTGPAQRLINTFVEAYNKKHPDTELNEDEVHFVKFNKSSETGEKNPGDVFVVPFDAPVQSFMESGEELFLKNGVSKSMEALNFTPTEETPDTDAKKDSPTTAKEASAAPAKRSSLAAALAAANAKLAAEQREKNAGAGVDVDDRAGKVRCEHFGCQKWYAESENNDHACRYHSKPPVFHDTRKFYSCCEDKVAWDWDSFEAIEGCCVGPHSTEKSGNQLFLGGTDVRAAAGATTTGDGPQRIFTGFDKVAALRDSCVKVGVSGPAFDAARDAVKTQLESQSVSGDIWEAVAAELGKKLTVSLESIASEAK
eukprot:CAMPEP_0171549632 /NCGR_PEP_ID=MMETSP0960-20121227/6554_1 /TAXON_ID=87120 /ORGANISM="Aurantiochytrium limacinum, Strain ATCCMYA-1381" /LENGTH=337 /DNA_ID=CAMNT_0012098353 /DNA_START=53 /DNA_END=1066 /DNA_ORIENTATION=+